MNKPFKTYRQQLNILRRRNLNIPDGSKAIRILKREGYYNIINGYKDIFLDELLSKQKQSDWYKNDMCFDYIYALYDFDRNFRQILLKYLLKMETAFKTKIAYHFSQKFKQNFNYLDINNFDPADPQRITALIARISKVITDNSEPKDQGGQFYHYLDKYKELPLWVLVKKMTLGEIIHFFKALQPDMKESIITEVTTEYAKIYKIQQPLISDQASTSFYNMLTFLNQFRNICAHDERLYNTIIKKYKKIPKINLFHLQQNIQFNSKLFDCIIILKLFISKKDYQYLIHDLSKEIHSLSIKLPQNIYNLVLIKMGFPKTWSDSINSL